jgi:nitrite reductase/ring-hydroxylating ferredoxin subunit
VPVRERARAAPTEGELLGLAAGWWPVAFSSELGGEPLGVRLGEHELALYRDADGAARAVVDRCPHRRLPLSMGRVTDAGIQCGYHGWTFDGSTGRCSLIPNFRPGEQPSGRIRVPAYQVSESDGLIFAWTGAAGPAASPVPPAGAGQVAPAGGGPRYGRAEVRAPQPRVADALLFNPGAALGLGWLLGAGAQLLGPEVEADGPAVTAHRTRLTFDLPRAGTFDPISERATAATVTTVAATGVTVVAARTPLGGGAVRIVVALTPAGAYRTTARWRIEASGGGARATLSAYGLASAARTLIGSAPGRLERAADAVERVADPAVDRLRDLRAACTETPAGKDA